MVYYWVSWLAIISIAFFFSNDLTLRKLFLWVLLLNVIFINVQIQIDDFTFTLPFIYTSTIFWSLIMIKTMPYFNYYLLFCLIFFYLSLRFILITSPIWLFVNQFLIIALLLTLVLIVLIRNHQERIYILVLACLTGEFLYAYHAKSLVWEIVVGEPELFLSLYLVIFLMSLFHRLTLRTQSIRI